MIYKSDFIKNNGFCIFTPPPGLMTIKGYWGYYYKATWLVPVRKP